MEALTLSKGVDKIEHHIRISENQGICLIDSKAVVQAKKKLDNGQLSSSRRVQDLLTNLSSKRMKVQHLSAKLPSPLLELVDFVSRHPIKCSEDQCRICVNMLSADTVFLGKTETLASDKAWQDIQRTCRDLRRTCALLTSGKKLSSKEKQANDLRQYLRHCTVNKNGLLVVLRTVPFQAKPAEAIVVPKPFTFSVAKAMHILWDHPNRTQMKQKFNRQLHVTRT